MTFANLSKPGVGHSARWHCLRRVAVLVMTGLLGCHSEESTHKPDSPPLPVSVERITSAEDELLLKKLCSQCHRFPEPDVLAKAHWERAILNMVRTPGYGKVINPKRLHVNAVTDWFVSRAPENLELTDRTQLPEKPPPLQRTVLDAPRPEAGVFGAQVRMRETRDGGGRQLLLSDMRSGLICEVPINDRLQSLNIYCDQVSHVARIEPIDLSPTVSTEWIASNLGVFLAMDHNLGTVDWLRKTDTGWSKTTLLDNVGRVADTKSFDFDADGDWDIAVAEFGWQVSGHVWLLENTTPKSASAQEPTFQSRVLDERHGAVQLEIHDLNQDGRSDVIGLLAQEHEVLVMYVNQPDGSFRIHELHRAPHPVWGYSGFQLLDFDGDQDTDVLITNGDMMDGPTIKPYHGISWLENQGNLRFVEHRLAELPGVHRAEATDLDADGDFDIVACTLVPMNTENQAKLQRGRMPPGLAWLEQTRPGQFQFHVWQHGAGRFPTLTTGDFDGDGKSDVALTIGLWDKPAKGQRADALELWLSKSGRR